jgi:predicted N-acyltransferase
VGLYDGDRLVGAVPLYLRTDSYGEFIFDWAWADFFHRNRTPYYPKLTAAPPFTPATGPRLLVHPDRDDADRLRLLLAEGIVAVGERVGASSAHVLFCLQPEAELLQGAGWIRRQTVQTAWENPGWPDFAAFLETLRAPARKDIRKERKKVAEQGLDIQTLRGDQLDDAGWRALRRFYETNVARHGAEAYLTPAFFAHLQRHLPHRVIACMAKESNRFIAGTLSLQKGQHLYGRYWGSDEDRPFLHFELAFYRLMDACIANGWTHFEPGAGGGHKINRGMLPVLVESAHWIAHPAFRRVIADHVAQERLAMADHAGAMALQATIKRDGLLP